ncbi:MAG: trypsin-like peptidase domain-containing protein [Pseudomonadota bacterium]
MRRLLLSCLFFATTLWADTRVPASQAEISLSFAPLVKEAAPAVVNIYAKRITQVSRRTPFMNDPFFDRFFENFGQPEPRVQNSLGSGVILSSDGIVVSNYHVVGMATEISVVLTDRREYSARVLLGDEDSDLAILQLEGVQDLPHLSLRNSDTVEVGELVLAIGNPFGVGQTVSSGIVSGLARSGGTNGGGRGYFIQTDAPINPGNSGGALIDVTGELIGINTRILSRSGGSNGIGFAIPANLVAAFVDQAQQGNTVFERPWAGLAGQTVDAEMAAMLALPRPGGIIISGVHEASPFAQSGFAVGDVIIEVDGVTVNSPSEMVYHMSVAGEGEEVRVMRIRDGTPEIVQVSLMRAPDDPPRNTTVMTEQTVLPGLSVEQINPAVLAELGLPIESTGVVVADPGPYGTRVGLRRGDVIQRVDGGTVDVPADVEQSLVRRNNRAIRMTLLRGQRRITLRF